MFTKPILDSVARAKLLQRQGQRNKFSLLPMSWLSEHVYGDVSESDDEQEDNTLDYNDEDVKNYLATRRTQRTSAFSKSWRTWVVVLSLILIATLGSFGLGYALARRPLPAGAASADIRPHPKTSGKQCGSSPTEARQRGCIFEPQLSAWVPSTCAFAELVTEYQEALGDMHSSPDWPWFWDRNLTQRVSPMEVPLLRAGNYTAIYTTYHRSHDLHCLYCWRKVSHALQNGFKMMDARCHQFYHAKHCAMHIGETLIRKEEDEVLEKWAYPLMYHDCVPLTSTDES